jgi:4-amino-4-deoxy-L-arabinose transferase-like glycosyltransferase
VPAGELDGAYYYHLAQRVAAGDVFLSSPDSFFGLPAPAFFVSPLYVYVLALFLKVGGTLEAARFAQVLLGAIGVGLVALTARRWFGSAAGWWAGLLAGGFGVFTFFEILILPAAIDPFLTALDLYLLTRALQAEGEASPRAQILWWHATGAAFGLHALNRPSMLIVLVGIVVAVVVRRALRFSKRQLAGPLAFVVAACILIAPITLRNYLVSHQFVLISSTGGLNLLVGNGPEANGTSVPVMGVAPGVRAQWIDAPRVARDAFGRDVTASEVSRFYRDRALAWMAANPGAELKLLGTKAWYALSAGFVTDNHSYPFFVRDLGGPLAWLVVGPALVVPLGLVSLVAARPRREGYWIWAAYVPLAVLSVVIFYVAARHRLPYQVALCAAAGGGIAWAIDHVRARTVTPLAVAAGATALAALLVLWPTRLDDGRAEERSRRAARRKGRPGSTKPLRATRSPASSIFVRVSCTNSALTPRRRSRTIRRRWRSTRISRRCTSSQAACSISSGGTRRRSSSSRTRKPDARPIPRCDCSCSRSRSSIARPRPTRLCACSIRIAGMPRRRASSR